MRGVNLFGCVAAFGIAATALADVEIELGDFTFGSGSSGLGSGWLCIETTPLEGTLTGIIVSFDYSGAVGGSWASDVAFTVDNFQWGGYDMYIAGADTFVSETGAPTSGSATSFTSAMLAGSGASYSNTTALICWGNGYSWSASGFTLENVSITLKGVEKIPTPGAVALLGLAGLVGRRRRSA